MFILFYFLEKEQHIRYVGNILLLYHKGNKKLCLCLYEGLNVNEIHEELNINNENFNATFYYLFFPLQIFKHIFSIIYDTGIHNFN